MTNIVLIIVDCLRKDYAYNREIMPYLNNNCHKKIQNAFTNCTTTWGAMPTLMTGIMPFSLSGRAGINDKIRRDYLAKIAKQNNFFTAGITTNLVTSHYYDYNYMFDFFEDFMPQEPKESLWLKLEKKLPKKIKNNELIKKIARIAMGIINPPLNLDVKNKIRGQEILKSFKHINFNRNQNFLYLHLIEPHQPYAPLNRVKKETKKMKKVNIKAFINHKNLTTKEKEYLKKLYEEEVQDSDKIVKEIISYLKKRLDWDKTLVIVLPDHGESLGETDYFEHVRYKLNNSHHIEIPMFFLGGLARELKYSDDLCLQDIYYIIKKILTNKGTEYTPSKFCVGHEKEIKPGESWFNSKHFVCSYHIPKTKKTFESRGRLDIKNVPQEVRDVYFKNFETKKIDVILESIDI